MRDKYKTLKVIANEYINEFNNDACDMMEKSTAAQINSLQAVGFGLGLDLSDHCIKFYFSFKKANGNIFKMYCSDVYLDIIKARSVNATNIDFANMGALLGLSEDVCKQRFHLNIMPLLANNNKLRLPWGVILKIAVDTCYCINTVNDLLLYGVNVNNRDHDAVFYAVINEASKIAKQPNAIITYEDIGNWIDYCYDKSDTFNDNELISEDDNEIVENDWDIDPEELLIKKQQVQTIAVCMTELDEQDHEILNMRFEFEDDAKFTLNRIAIECGLGGRQVALNRETLALSNFRKLYRMKTKYGIGENK